MRTLGLMAGVGLITFVVGTATAWLVTMCRFPLRPLFVWASLLPLAMPGYIVAYAYVDFLSYAGPLQTWLRGALRLEDARRLLVPRNPLAGRRHLRALDGALPLCLPHRAGELHPPAGNAARGGARTGPDAMGRLPHRGAAAGPARHRGGRVAGAHGMPERHRCRGLLRRPHADARRLHDLAVAGKSRRCGTDLRRHAALHLRAGVVRAHGAAQAVLRAALPAPAPAGPHPPQRLAARAGGHRLRAAHPHRLRRAGPGADELCRVAPATMRCPSPISRRSTIRCCWRRLRPPSPWCWASCSAMPTAPCARASPGNIIRARQHGLCHSRHGAGHRRPHSARGLRQCARRFPARAVRHLDRAAALGHDRGGHLRLCGALPRRLLRRHRDRACRR